MDSPTASYIQQLFNNPQLPPIAILSLFFLALMRIIPLVSFAPFFGAKLPGPIKMGIAISLALIMLPHLLQVTHKPIFFDTIYIGYALKELLIGFFIAFLAIVPFYIAQTAGTLIDFIRGSSALQVNDPTMQVQASPIGLLYNYTLIALFYQIDGPFLLFGGLLSSYDIIPPDGFLSSQFFNLKIPIWTTITSVLNRVLQVAIQISAPSIVAVLMAEFFLGIANRLAQQVQISFLGMALKSLMGLAFLALAWMLIVNQMGKQVLLWLNELLSDMTNLKPFIEVL